MGSLRTKGLAELMGITPQTVRVYVHDEVIPYHRSPSGQLFFTDDDIRKIMGDAETDQDEIWFYYLRSSSGRKSSLDNQLKELRNEYPEPVKIVRDSASGLNETRRGITTLLDKASKHEFNHIAITHPDRITRFGRTYIEQILNKCGVTVHYLHPEENSSPHEELMQDFMSLVASFSGRFYKMRSQENKKKLIQQASDELA